ncbi:hypothetical protein F5Y11DRAFT_343462 [Daldinia sp. FL1419]|nr:hypothetical protein F5Y11DRAFT_343462 [Daldinia sp. FL1419]
MQFGSLATLLVAFTTATSAMPGTPYNAERATQADAVEMPTSPDGYFDIRGNLLQSIGGDGQVLAERELDARGVEDFTQAKEAYKAKRDLGMSSASAPIKRASCYLNSCYENADCYQWTDDNFLRCSRCIGRQYCISGYGEK